MIEIKTRADALKHITNELTTNKHIIPSLPQALVRVQKAVNDKAIGAKELADVILDDPSLTASVLRLANSAYYRHTKAKIRTITSAIVLLGFETIRNLALGLSVYNMLSNLPKVRNYQQVWRHSLCCAVCAQHFAKLMRIPVPEEAFVAGLLHDMGKLILGQFFPEHYAQVLNRIDDGSATYLQAERDIIKVDHMEIGRFIAEHWSFPQDIVSAIGRHEIERYAEGLDGTAPPLENAVIVANKVAHFLYKDQEPGQSEVRMPDIQYLCSTGLGIDADKMEDIIGLLKEQVRDIAHILDIVIDEWRYDSNGNPVDGNSPSESAVNKKDHDRLQFLLECNQAAARCDDFASFLKDTIEKLFHAIDLNYVFLLINNRDFGCLEAKFGFGPDIEHIREKIAIRIDTADDVAAKAYLEDHPVVVNPENMQEFSRLCEANLVGLLGTFNIAAIPIDINDHPIAVLVVSREYDSQNITAEDLGILSMYVQNLTAVLGRNRIRGGTSVIRKSTTSVLTKKSSTTRIIRNPESGDRH
ncbi:MAG: HDOD domain-containing protein [Planctomycetes bacterium]|nr:HDOD domain-containing protein [Planctomycetota bacterium]